MCVELQGLLIIKYIIFGLIVYAVCSNLLLLNRTQVIVTTISTVTILILIDQFYNDSDSNNNHNFRRNYINPQNCNKIIPDLNTAPDYNENDNFQMHDNALNYYDGFYPPWGDAPVGNALQNLCK